MSIKKHSCQHACMEPWIADRVHGMTVLVLTFCRRACAIKCALLHLGEGCQGPILTVFL